MKAFATEPWDRDVGQTEVGGDQEWVVGSPMKPDQNGIGFDGHMGGAVYKVSEDAPGFSDFIAVSNSLPQETIEARCHESELHITVDLHGHCRG